MLNNGDGSFQQPTTCCTYWDFLVDVLGKQTIDLNRDGINDLAYSSFETVYSDTSTVFIALGSPDGLQSSNELRFDLPSRLRNAFIDIGDYDGLPGDELIAVYQYSQYANSEETNFEKDYFVLATFDQNGVQYQDKLSVPIEQFPWRYKDINSDNVLELFTLSNNDVIQYVKNGNEWQQRNSYSIANKPVDLMLEDINQDDFIDIVTFSRQENTLSILLGNEQGFDTRQDITLNCNFKSKDKASYLSFNTDENKSVMSVATSTIYQENTCAKIVF